MRRIITAMLLGATMASPLAAQNWQDRREARENRQDVRQSREEVRDSRREVREQRQEVRRDVAQGRFGEARRDQRELQRDRAELRQDRRELGRDRAEQWRDRQAVRGGYSQTPGERYRDVRQGLRDDNRDWRDNRGDRRDDRRDWRDDRGRDGRWNEDRRWGDNRWDGRRGPDRDWRDDRGRGNGSWNRGWRNDRRYDWQGWRNSNRNAYRLPRYYAPRGYAGQYRRWSPGYRIQPYFYGSNYWISDPWAYRLPPAYGGYRWVRYYDDVMLVDVRSGLIEDIIYSFFYR